MSHQDYIAGCDEGQLKRLVELANERLKAIQQTGWVKLWCVSVGFGNVGWFRHEDFAGAVACAKAALARHEHEPRDLDLEICLNRYRPDEVAELLAYAQAAHPAQGEKNASVHVP